MYASIVLVKEIIIKNETNYIFLTFCKTQEKSNFSEKGQNSKLSK